MNPSLTNPELRQQFLDVLEETCSVKHACAACGITRSIAYYHRKADLQFSRDWDTAVQRALDDLLGEAHMRATEGRSDRLLEVLLKFRYGDQLADRLAVRVEQSTGLSADALLRMNPDDRAALELLLTKYVEADKTLQLEHDGAQSGPGA